MFRRRTLATVASILLCAGISTNVSGAPASGQQLRSSIREVWVMVMVVYAAPSDAVDWHGPYTRDKVIAGGKLPFFGSESECKREAQNKINQIHTMMLAPLIFRCVSFPESLSQE